jgi:hypothetical protein
MAMEKQHADLFDRYVKDLTSALDVARRARTAGLPPAAHPRVLGVVIEYFFACERLNEAMEAEGRGGTVEPVVFVHEMLSGTHQALWRALAQLPYLPPGLSRDDEWV